MALWRLLFKFNFPRLAGMLLKLNFPFISETIPAFFKKSKYHLWYFDFPLLTGLAWSYAREETGRRGAPAKLSFPRLWPLWCSELYFFWLFLVLNLPVLFSNLATYLELYACHCSLLKFQDRLPHHHHHCLFSVLESLTTFWHFAQWDNFKMTQKSIRHSWKWTKCAFLGLQNLLLSAKSFLAG